VLFNLKISTIYEPSSILITWVKIKFFNLLCIRSELDWIWYIFSFWYTLIRSSMFTVRNSNYSCEAILFFQSKWKKNVSFAVFVKIKRPSWARGPSPLTTIPHLPCESSTFSSDTVRYGREICLKLHYKIFFFAIRIMSVVEKIKNHRLSHSYLKLPFIITI
jgi:hypothetical protein